MAGIWGPPVLPYMYATGRGGDRGRAGARVAPGAICAHAAGPDALPDAPPPDDAESLVFGVSMSVVTEKEVTPRRGAGEIR